MRPRNLLTKVNEVDYEQAVSLFYEPLYGFVYSLSGNENDACELTQETFARLLAKGGQLRDGSKVKSWLFTTLYRVFLGWKSRERRLPHLEISSLEHELPPLQPNSWTRWNATQSAKRCSKLMNATVRRSRSTIWKSTPMKRSQSCWKFQSEP